MISTNSTQVVAAAFDAREDDRPSAIGVMDAKLVGRIGSWFSKATGSELEAEAGLYFLTEVLVMLLADLHSDGVAALRRRADDRGMVEGIVQGALLFGEMFPPDLPALEIRSAADANHVQAWKNYRWQVLEDLSVASAELRELVRPGELDEQQYHRAIQVVSALVAATMRTAS